MGMLTSELLMDPAVSLLLQSTILLDTDNLEDVTKTTDLDRDMLMANAAKVPADTAWGCSRSEWYKRLKALRGDLSGFSMVDVMKKDLKFGSSGGESFAIASAPATLESMKVLESKGALEAFAAEMEAFMQKNNLGSVYVITQSTGDLKQLVAATSTDEWNQISTAFEQAISSDKEYGGIALKGSNAEWGVDGVGHVLTAGCTVIALFNFVAAASRKQVLPAIDDFFKE